MATTMTMPTATTAEILAWLAEERAERQRRD
jgi:hypothetical protein